jgi:hypothetical protein
MAPLVSTRGGITVKAYGFTNGGAADFRAFFVATPAQTTWYWNGDGIGNIYAGGLIASTSTNILKINATAGTLTWQKQDTGAQIGGPRNVAVDATTGLVTFGNGVSGQTGFHYVLTGAGAISYQRQMNGGSVGQGLNSFPRGLDSSGNLHGATASTGPWYYIYKFNSSGTQQWQRQLTRSNCDFYFFNGVVVDGAGSVYVHGGGLDNGGAGFFPFVAKYNSSGALQWQQTLWGIGFSPRAIKSTGTGNLAVVTHHYSTQTRWITSLFNQSTGATIWQRELTGVTSIVARDVATDSASNVYSMARVGIAELYIAKYNSSGALQWQRRITSSGSGTFRPDEATIFVTDNLDYYVGFNHSTGSFCLRLPQDGTLTGTYVIGGQTITYATVTSLTDNAFTSGWSGGLLTDASGAQGFVTSSRSFTDTTYTLSVI